MRNNFNMVIVGVGGQGQITLLKVLLEAALIEGYDLRSSELHGLSQRGGSVEVHLRIGERVLSPLVSQARADFVLALEFQEALKALYYTSAQTKFLINKYSLSILGKAVISEKAILKEIKKFTRNIETIAASQICQKELKKKILAGVYLISLASQKNLIPLKPNSILKAIKKIIPEKYLELNLKAFSLAES